MKKRIVSLIASVALLGSIFGVAFRPTPAAAAFDPNEGYLSDCLNIPAPGAFESCLEAIIALIRQTLNLPPVLGPEVNVPEIIHNAVDPVLQSISQIFQIPAVNTQSVAAPSAPALVKLPDVAGTIGNTLSKLTDSVSTAAALPAVAPKGLLDNLSKTPISKVLHLQGISADTGVKSDSPFSSADLMGMAAVAGLAMLGGTTVLRRRMVAKAGAKA